VGFKRDRATKGWMIGKGGVMWREKDDGMRDHDRSREVVTVRVEWRMKGDRYVERRKG
jgi:hypothetical protein